MNSFKYLISLFAALIIFSPYAEAADDGVLSARADSAYSNGDFATAINLYEEVCENGGVSAPLLFNLGNSYSRSGDYGHALLSYLRAQRLDPGNGKINHNIEYIKYKVTEANKSELRGKKYSLDSDPIPFLSSVRKGIVADHSSNSWAIWCAVMFILFVVSLCCYVFTSNVLVRKIGFFGGFVCLGVALLMMFFAFWGATYKSDDGVIITPKVKLLSEASSASKEFPVALTRGTCLKILDSFPAHDKNPQWYKVKLNSDFIGWIQSSDFEPVGY